MVVSNLLSLLPSSVEIIMIDYYTEKITIGPRKAQVRNLPIKLDAVACSFNTQYVGGIEANLQFRRLIGDKCNLLRSFEDLWRTFRFLWFCGLCKLIDM